MWAHDIDAPEHYAPTRRGRIDGRTCPGAP